MRKRLAILACGCVLFASGCSTIRKITDTVDKLEQMTAKTELKLDGIEKFLSTLQGLAGQFGDKGQLVLEIVGKVRETLAAADKNQDNKVSGISEWQALLGGLLSIVLGAFFGQQKGKEAIAVATKNTDELWDKVESLADKLKGGA